MVALIAECVFRILHEVALGMASCLPGAKRSKRTLFLIMLIFSLLCGASYFVIFYYFFPQRTSFHIYFCLLVSTLFAVIYLLYYLYFASNASAKNKENADNNQGS